MATLYTLAFPTLSREDRHWINQRREQHDPVFLKVRPHFTLLFGGTDIPRHIYSRHVAKIAERESSFKFQARRVSVGVDYFGSGGYAFLVPDEGHSNLLSLHDKLYSGPLLSHRRLDLPYVPHITLGKYDSLEKTQQLCSQLNEQRISISGIVDTLTIVAEENGAVRELEQFVLAGV